MKVICSYCQKTIGQREPLDSSEVSHGMCVECFKYFDRQWSGLTLSEYLNRYDTPVVVVNTDARVVAVNRAMAHKLGKTQQEMLGLLGGEAMECAFARLPGGCGRTEHCPTCTLRNTVEDTMSTGKSHYKVKTSISQGKQVVSCNISTFKEGETVRVEITNVKVFPVSNATVK